MGVWVLGMSGGRVWVHTAQIWHLGIDKEQVRQGGRTGLAVC